VKAQVIVRASRVHLIAASFFQTSIGYSRVRVGAHGPCCMYSRFQILGWAKILASIRPASPKKKCLVGCCLHTKSIPL
jgi:hypothetical protein